ncbi:DegT/DnrJ/EryC1/StrS family aminotransferase [Bacteriovoracales bacterium]|nr:DegT/DnrJ/EryC1/StrS family aminotransferase [Bacteriovoracales bacterium]
MKVPYGYLSRQFSNPTPILDQIKELVSEGDFTLGKKLEKFENEFSNFIGSKYAIGVGSGTDALFLSLKALGIGDGKGYKKDEVITTANTFVATVGSIETAGARTRFVDCNEKYVMDVNKVEEAITEKTKAIMPVHYSGQPVEMDKLLKIANKYNLYIIEDACCAIDAEVDGKRCGTIGITGAFSLHPQKNLNVWSDGGVIVTNDSKMKEKLHLLRNHGMKDRDHYAFYAYNSRLDPLQAIVGSHLLPDVKWITNKRIEIAQKIDKGLEDLKEYIQIPNRPLNERRVYHMYMLLVQDRDKLYNYLLKNGVDAKIHYPIPLHLQEASKHLNYQEGDFPTAEYQAKNIISLPAHQHLTDEEVDYTIEMVRKFYL